MIALGPMTQVADWVEFETVHEIRGICEQFLVSTFESLGREEDSSSLSLVLNLPLCGDSHAKPLVLDIGCWLNAQKRLQTKGEQVPETPGSARRDGPPL